MNDLAAGGRAQAAADRQAGSICPSPMGPTTASSSPGADLHRHMVERLDPLVPVAEGERHVNDLQAHRSLPSAMMGSTRRDAAGSTRAPPSSPATSRQHGRQPTVPGCSMNGKPAWPSPGTPTRAATRPTPTVTASQHQQHGLAEGVPQQVPVGGADGLDQTDLRGALNRPDQRRTRRSAPRTQ